MSLLAYSPTLVFAGEADKVSVRGQVLRAKCLPGGRAMERSVPRMILQEGCNHALFSVGCGLAAADWQFDAVVSDPGTAGWPFEFALSGLTRTIGAAPTFFADWFAGGWIRFGSGGASRSVPIVRSSVVSGGAVTLTLSRDPAPFPTVGQVVALWPGCDGRMVSCKAYHATTNPEGRFNNFLNFGGHPFRPVANPSLVKLSNTLAGGKK